MLRFIERQKDGASAFEAGASRVAAPETAANADLARYRLLAKQLAARRESDREAEARASNNTTRPTQAPASSKTPSAAGGKPLAPPPDQLQTKAKSVVLPERTAVALAGRRKPRVVWIAASLAAVACVAWFYRSDLADHVSIAGGPESHGGDLLHATKAPHVERDDAQAASSEGARGWHQPEPFESALIDKVAQDQTLFDLRQALQRAEALSALYAALLARERARNHVLEAQMAAHLEDSPATPSDTSGLSAPPASDRPVMPARDEPPSVAAAPSSQPSASSEPHASDSSMANAPPASDRPVMPARDEPPSVAAAPSSQPSASSEPHASDSSMANAPPASDQPVMPARDEPPSVAAAPSSQPSASSEPHASDSSMANAPPASDQPVMPARDEPPSVAAAPSSQPSASSEPHASDSSMANAPPASDQPVMPARDEPPSVAAAPSSQPSASSEPHASDSSMANAPPASDQPVMPARDEPPSVAAAPSSQPSASSEPHASDSSMANAPPASDQPVMPARDEPPSVAAAPPREKLHSLEKPPPLLGAPELSRLMSRATLLREHGDIGAARNVLERAAETGHGPALFALAETYDPGVLRAWGTYGTKGDVAKAREFYTQALAAGAKEARARLESLRQ